MMQSLPISDLQSVAAGFFAVACVLCVALLLRMQRTVNTRASREERVPFLSLRPRGAVEKTVRREYRRIYPRSDVPRLFRISQWVVVAALVLLLLSFGLRLV